MNFVLLSQSFYCTFGKQLLYNKFYFQKILSDRKQSSTRKKIPIKAWPTWRQMPINKGFVGHATHGETEGAIKNFRLYFPENIRWREFTPITSARTLLMSIPWFYLGQHHALKMALCMQCRGWIICRHKMKQLYSLLFFTPDMNWWFNHPPTKWGKLNSYLQAHKLKGVPVIPIHWTGVCRLDHFDGLERGWPRGR